MNKYRNRRTVVDGISFHSAAEAKRYGELKLEERAGVIRGLKLQPKFPVVINGVKVFTYIADFSYFYYLEDRTIVEDVKGCETALFKIKQKCVEACYPGLKIELVKVRQ